MYFLLFGFRPDNHPVRRQRNREILLAVFRGVQTLILSHSFLPRTPDGVPFRVKIADHYSLFTSSRQAVDLRAPTVL